MRVLRKNEAAFILAISKTNLQNKINEKLLPPPFSLGARAVGFLEHEINSVLAAMIAGKSKEDIKALVERLIIDRQGLLEDLI